MRWIVIWFTRRLVKGTSTFTMKSKNQLEDVFRKALSWNAMQDKF